MEEEQERKGSFGEGAEVEFDNPYSLTEEEKKIIKDGMERMQGKPIVWEITKPMVTKMNEWIVERWNPGVELVYSKQMGWMFNQNGSPFLPIHLSPPDINRGFFRQFDLVLKQEWEKLRG